MTDTDNSNEARTAIVGYIVLLLLVNIAGCAKIYSAGGWAQLGMLVFVAPIYEGLFLLFGCIMVWRLDKKYPQKDFGLYWFTVIALPILLYAVTAMFTFAYSKGGC
ncbi:MAG: hypothetical protein JST82_05825 [Bacteroidetes bacterium]|nr:hypothetical protein [Bacteroidota bacterium]